MSTATNPQKTNEVFRERRGRYREGSGIKIAEMEISFRQRQMHADSVESLSEKREETCFFFFLRRRLISLLTPETKKRREDEIRMRMEGERRFFPR